MHWKLAFIGFASAIGSAVLALGLQTAVHNHGRAVGIGMERPVNENDDEVRAMKLTTLPDIPVGLTSFGGAVIDGHCYIYGGHSGAAHEYYAGGQNTHVYRLNLSDPDSWESVGTGPGLQGLAMVAHDGRIYRLGGFRALNQQGEDQNLESVTDFAQLDRESGNWISRQPMPVARSSFDAVVVGDHVYVVGGWTMNGANPTQWRTDAYRLNLADEHAEWEKLVDPPFQRRAISLGYVENQIVAIGGMQQRGGPTTQVAIYDIDSGEWSDGPQLPGEGMEGFGSSCFHVGGKLIVSTYGGSVYQMEPKADGWKKIRQLETGRFFHRLLPAGDNGFLLVGGASMETGKITETVLLEWE